MRKLLAAVLTLAWITPLHAQNRADVLIRHATIVDVERARLIPDQAIVVSRNRIVAAGDDADIANVWAGARTSMRSSAS